jgi:hypothetical protein
MWNVAVADVNRAPVAVISSPTAKAEFMLGEDIVLDGSASSDPDGDALSTSWSEASKPLGTGQTLTVKLAKGAHMLTLSVDDGKKNGIATAQVEIYVRYLDFKATLTVDSATPTEGKKIALSAKLINKGDGSIDELPVTFSVDGTEVASTTIESIEPDADFPLEFSWKAVKGDHKLEVGVNNQIFSKTVTVAKKQSEAPPEIDMTIWMAVAVVAVIAAVAAVVVFSSRKKRAAVQPPEYEGYPEQIEEVPYQQLQEEAPAAVAQTAASYIPAAPPSAPPAPAMTEQDKAREAIDKIETLLQEAEDAGLDTAKARLSFKVARNFYEMGKYQKALLYCQNAENNLE